MASLKNKETILTDINMVKYGITRYEGEVECYIKNEEVVKIAKEHQITRAAAAIKYASQNDFDNNLAVCDMLAFIGYPEPFYDTERQAPILRSGIIASDPRFNYMEKQFGNCLAYEAFSLGGSSGSPVFAIQKGFKTGKGISAPDGFYRPVLLVGINAGHYSNEEGHSGISWFYKSSAIIEIIESS